MDDEVVQAKDSLEEKELRRDRPKLWDETFQWGLDMLGFVIGIMCLSHCH